MGSFEPVRSDNLSREADARARLADVRAFLEASLIDGGALVERLLIGLLADGHLLVEGAPGLAKTRAVKLLARGLNVAFAQIQCTPDLMPADVTGTRYGGRIAASSNFPPGRCFTLWFWSMRSIARRRKCSRLCWRRWPSAR